MFLSNGDDKNPSASYFLQKHCKVPPYLACLPFCVLFSLFLNSKIANSSNSSLYVCTNFSHSVTSLNLFETENWNFVQKNMIWNETKSAKPITKNTIAHLLFRSFFVTWRFSQIMSDGSLAYLNSIYFSPCKNLSWFL